MPGRTGHRDWLGRPHRRTVWDSGDYFEDKTEEQEVRHAGPQRRSLSHYHTVVKYLSCCLLNTWNIPA